MKRIGFYLPLIGIAAVCILLIALFAASRAAGTAENPGIANAADAARVLLSEYGWEVAGIPSSVRTVAVPAEFTPAYEEYNELQRSQGFDLSPYRGRTLTAYTFRILNHPAPGDIYANLLVFNGEVVAGDVVSYALDGFLTTL